MADHDPLHPALQERRRFPLIWIVPIVALLAAGWLGYRTLSERGPRILITLQSAEGIEAGKTQIKHKDIQLGVVETVEPSADLSSVKIHVRMNRYAEPHLKTGTRFWVVRPRFSAEGVSGLGTLITGSYIEMEPGPGEPARRFTALEDPPVVSADVPGTAYLLHGRQLGSVSQGAPVTFRGVKVGEVLGYHLSDEDGNTTVQVFVRAPHDKLVRDGTRFWNASGLSLGLTSEGFKLQTASLQSILAGGVAFDVPPGGVPGALAKDGAPFTLYPSEDEADAALFTRRVPFMLRLTGDAGGLSVGSAVRMHGIRVGDVTDVHMEYDAKTNQVTVPVTFELEPQRVTLLNMDQPETGFVEQSYAIFKNFVADGLRARVTTGNFLTGQKIISLDFVPDAPKAELVLGGPYPEMPAIESDDIQSVLQSAKGLLNGLQQTASALNKIVTAPEVSRSLASLDRSLASADRLLHDASGQVGPLLAGLRNVSASADQTLKQATSTLAVTGDALSNEGQAGGDLAGTLLELKQAARSLHVLTDYLDSHPEALVQGKAAGAAK